MIYKIDNAKTTALLIIDAQQEYFSPTGVLYTPNAESIRMKLALLKRAANRSGASVVVVQHIHKADGSDVGRMGDFDPRPAFVEGTDGVAIIQECEPHAADHVITKTRYSAFVGTDLDAYLRGHGIDTVIIAGLMTNYCCVTTARHAHDLDYKVVFISDANAGPDMPDLGFGEIPHDEVLKDVCTSLAGGVADVQTTNDVIEQLESNTVRGT